MLICAAAYCSTQFLRSSLSFLPMSAARRVCPWSSIMSEAQFRIPELHCNVIIEISGHFFCNNRPHVGGVKMGPNFPPKSGSPACILSFLDRENYFGVCGRLFQFYITLYCVSECQCCVSPRQTGGSKFPKKIGFHSRTILVLFGAPFYVLGSDMWKCVSGSPMKEVKCRIVIICE